MAWGARQPFPPLGRRPPNPRWVLAAPRPKGAYIKGGREGSNLQPWASPSSPATPLSLSQKLGEALPETRYIHHHAVVLLDLHQPLLPPCWIKKEETSLLRTCVERGGAVRSALGSSVIWITTSTTPSSPFFERFRSRSTRYVDASNHSLLDELIDGSW